MADDIEKLYEQALDHEIGDTRKITNRVRASVYEGEIAFALQMHCVKRDFPPPGKNDDSYYYRFTMTGLNHDMTMYILTNLRDAFPPGENITSTGSRRNAVRRELAALGIAHMGRWVTCCKDGTFTISMRHLTHEECVKLCKILFSY